MIEEYEIKYSVILNLEKELKYLDNILSTLKQYPRGLYVKNIRYPFKEEDGLIISPNNVLLNLDAELPTDVNMNIVDKKNNLIVSGHTLANNGHCLSNKPFHPILSIDFLHTLFNTLQYINNPHKDLLINNTLLNKRDPLMSDIDLEMKYLEDVIYYYFNGMDNSGLRIICEFTYNNLVPILSDFLDHDHNAFYTMNINNLDIILNRHDDIRTIRYNMCLNHKKLMEEIANV